MQHDIPVAWIFFQSWSPVSLLSDDCTFLPHPLTPPAPVRAGLVDKQGIIHFACQDQICGALAELATACPVSMSGKARVVVGTCRRGMGTCNCPLVPSSLTWGSSVWNGTSACLLFFTEVPLQLTNLKASSRIFINPSRCTTNLPVFIQNSSPFLAGKNHVVKGICVYT